MADLGAIGTASPGSTLYSVITSGGSIIGAEGSATGAVGEFVSTVGYVGMVPGTGIDIARAILKPEYGTFYTADSFEDNTGTISGTIRRNGVNQAGVYVALLHEITGVLISKQTTDVNGNFSFSNLYKNQAIYTIVAWGDAYTLGLTQSNLTPTNAYILDYLDSGGSTRVQTKVLTDVAGRVRETTISSYLSYTTTIGDGSSTSFVLTHSLDSRDLIIQVRRATAPYDLVDVAIEYTSVNTVTLTFASPPATNDFRVIILG